MALSQALSTGITGLMTHQKAMDNIGNNLANVNTVGFKKGVFQFSTLLEQTLRGGMGAEASTNRGSVNPIALGLGTQTYSINKVFTQGPIENTGNPYDMAIDGNGFFVLKQGNNNVFTRAGSFYKGEDGSLLAGAGLYVQGTMAVRSSDGSYSIPTDAKLQNIVIPLGTTGGHSQTTEVAFTGNLDSRKAVSTGTNLFGGTSFPSVNSLQQWMNKDFNGGTGKGVDESWSALENPTYAISQATLDAFNAAGISLPSNVTVYAGNTVTSFTQASTTDSTFKYALDTTTGEIVNINGKLGPNQVPLIEEVKTINGGNVQTSAAYGIKVPDTLYMNSTVDGVTINNHYTYPKWFYESTGGDWNAALAAASLSDADYEAQFGQAGGVFEKIWPNGFNPDTLGNSTKLTSTSQLPHKDEIYPASLNTPLEHLRYLNGNVWVEPFANIKNGDEVTIAFKKGDSQMEAKFVYNRPDTASPVSGQQSLHQEKSFTLEHLVKFLAGDVDEPTVACQNITPAMFGATVTADYPDGDPNTDSTLWDPKGYQDALKNVELARNMVNMDQTGGAMGLLSIPPQISESNFGGDRYDVPGESAGAYTRVMQTVNYDRWDPTTQKMISVPADSFNISFVSNLGAQNALSDIKINYGSVPNNNMFTAEVDYSEPDAGGASIITVDFYDSLGNPKQAIVRLAMVDRNNDFTTWRWYADSVDDTDFPWQTDADGNINSNLSIGTGTFRFDKNGNFVLGSDHSETNGITINQSSMGVNEPILIGIKNGLSALGQQSLDFSEMTCTADVNGYKLKSQNGNPPGTMTGFTVSLDGIIQGTYSNGNTVPIGRMALALIPNEHGLVNLGNSLFAASPASGKAIYGHAGVSGNGSICSQQLESSNVDLSEEFTKLITTERGFQANSKTITTSDEMIQELINLKR